MTSRFRRNGVHLAYDDLGDPDAPAILFLHGLSDSRRTWAALPEKLAARRRVLRLDFRGHGESDRVPGGYFLPEYGDDVAAFCDAVLGGPAVLVGHSLGGITAAYLAARRPELVRGAFLEDPPMFLNDPNIFASTAYPQLFALMQAAIRQVQSTDDPVSGIRSILAQAPGASGKPIAEVLGPEGVERQAWAWAHLDADAFDPALQATLWAGHDVDAPIACPVTVLRADPALGPAFFPEHEARFRTLAPQAEFALCEDASHMIHVEQPDRFEKLLSDFLARA